MKKAKLNNRCFTPPAASITDCVATRQLYLRETKAALQFLKSANRSSLLYEFVFSWTCSTARPTASLLRSAHSHEATLANLKIVTWLTGSYGNGILGLKITTFAL